MSEFFNKLRWVYGTRLIGTVLLGYALLNPKDPDRGTFVLAGITFLGGELVADRGTKEPKD